MNLLPLNPAYTAAMGYALGYPSCCVDSFANGRYWNHVPKATQKALAGKLHFGFVPCEMHCQMLIRSEITSRELIPRDSISNHELRAIQKRIRAELERNALTVNKYASMFDAYV